MPNSNCL